MQVIDNQQQLLSGADLQRYFAYPPKVARSLFIGLILMSIVGLCTLSTLTSNAPGMIGTGLFLLFLASLPFDIAIVRLIWYHVQAKPTDAQYEAWVRSWLPGMQKYGMQRLGLAPGEILGAPLFVRGIIWFHTQESAYYHSHGCPVRVLRGKDGNLHASINKFTFFYPTQHYIAVFSGHVNALHPLRSESTQTYFYDDIVGVETTTYGQQFETLVYTLQQFELRVSSGQSVGATTYARDADVEQTVRSLRTLLQDKKYGTRGGGGGGMGFAGI
ncbi:hypothetical protein [Dictyobacter kobayashii]|uniref:Uncharacterized protein n=1 Tax=Dictyobacter kobayashii TaxID=2014872 RepID=A0A402APU5_9CHLR|nr:hypothetical protein [Dictyobacter kobayashii]GCE21049.1 hypothetical protein KDK_48490 [Dictyobacter kobayashii]